MDNNMNYWPYTNIHELNLDWIISKVKELDTRFTDDIETFVRDYIDEHFAEWTVNANYNPDDETIIYTNGTGATLTAGDVIRFAIDNAFVNIKDQTSRNGISALNTRMASAENAINTMPTTILNTIHPIGSEYVTSTNTAPSIGGTWALIEKELRSVDRGLVENTDYTMLGTAESRSIQYKANGHIIELRIGINGTFTEDSIDHVQFDLSKLGLSTFTNDRGVTTFSDTGDALVPFIMTSTGILRSVDCVVFGSSISRTYTGALNVFDFIIVVDSASLLDSACDRFTWRRVS